MQNAPVLMIFPISLYASLKIRGDMDAERLNPWIKIVVLRLLMEKVPYLMWVDADVMFRDMNFNLTKFVELHMIPGVQILTADDMVSQYCTRDLGDMGCAALFLIRGKIFFLVLRQVDIHSSGFLVLRNTTVVKSWMERWYISGQSPLAFFYQAVLGHAVVAVENALCYIPSPFFQNPGWLHNNNQSLRVFKEPTVIDLFRR